MEKDGLVVKPEPALPALECNQGYAGGIGSRGREACNSGEVTDAIRPALSPSRHFPQHFARQQTTGGLLKPGIGKQSLHKPFIGFDASCSSSKASQVG